MRRSALSHMGLPQIDTRREVRKAGAVWAYLAPLAPMASR